MALEHGAGFGETRLCHADHDASHEHAVEDRFDRSDPHRSVDPCLLSERLLRPDNDVRPQPSCVDRNIDLLGQPVQRGRADQAEWHLVEVRDAGIAPDMDRTAGECLQVGVRCPGCHQMPAAIRRDDDRRRGGVVVVGSQVEQAEKPREPSAVFAGAKLSVVVLHGPFPVAAQPTIVGKAHIDLLSAHRLDGIAPDLLDDGTHNLTLAGQRRTFVMQQPEAHGCVARVAAHRGMRRLAGLADRADVTP